MTTFKAFLMKLELRVAVHTFLVEVAMLLLTIGKYFISSNDPVIENKISGLLCTESMICKQDYWNTSRRSGFKDQNNMLCVSIQSI